MQAHIELLVKLQAVEIERTRLAKEARALPLQVADAEAALTAAEKKVAAANTALTSEEALRTRSNRDLESLRQKVARFRTQQDSVTTPAQATAIEHELNFATTEINRLEAEDLSSLERTEAQDAALATFRTQVEALALTLDKTRARVALQQAEIDRELAALATVCESTRKLIAPELLVRFDRIAKSRGTGLASAADQRCAGCRMGIRPQTWNQLREGELLTCDSCGRLIYWNPSMAPAVPEEAKPTKAAPRSRAKAKKDD